jgi:hypothetical protein
MSFLKLSSIFPLLLMTLDLLASLIYLISKDYARALYWLAAGLITFSTLLIKG